MGRVPGKPSLTPAEQADLLPPSKPSPAPNRLPPEVELPPGAEAARTASISSAAEPPPIVRPEAGEAGAAPLVVNAVKSATLRLTPEERELLRLRKNAILFAFFVAVLLVVFWWMAG